MPLKKKTKYKRFNMRAMRCEWLKDESNYFATRNYFGLILQPLQTVANV